MGRGERGALSWSCHPTGPRRPQQPRPDRGAGRPPAGRTSDARHARRSGRASSLWSRRVGWSDRCRAGPSTLMKPLNVWDYPFLPRRAGRDATIPRGRRGGAGRHHNGGWDDARTRSDRALDRLRGQRRRPPAPEPTPLLSPPMPLAPTVAATRGARGARPCAALRSRVGWTPGGLPGRRGEGSTRGAPSSVQERGRSGGRAASSSPRLATCARRAATSARSAAASPGSPEATRAATSWPTKRLAIVAVM
jgi:hypothetical protein